MRENERDFNHAEPISLDFTADEADIRPE